jgi:short-subunit dehydrogenase
MRFAGQIVWITGASSGIGEATAYAFAREGARLVLSSRRANELERVRQACERPGEHAIVPLDLARSATFPGIVSEVLARCGHLDVLINNGGVGQRSFALDATEATERALMEVDYFGPVALTKAVLPSMRERQSGHVVVISSVMGYLGTPGRSSYAAAKHALNGYFDSLRAEHWREGIHVTIVCPGYVQTAISAHALGVQSGAPRRTEEIGRRGMPAEKCAGAILRAVAGRREEVYVGGREVFGIYLKRFTPWLISKIVRRMKFSVDAQP